MSTNNPTQDPRGEPPEGGFDTAWKLNKKDPTANFSDAELAELAVLSTLPENIILERAGKMGPALIGRPLYHLASQIRVNNPTGALGPAILDPDYDAKALAKRGLRRGDGGRIEPLDALDSAEGSGESDAAESGAPSAAELEAAGVPVDPANLTDPRNPWTYVSLSGAKQLAITAQHSHRPRIKRDELIAELQKVGVTPPPVPSPEDLQDDDGEDEQ